MPRTTGEAAALAARHDERLDGRAWLEIEEDLPIRYALEPRSPGFGTPEAVRMLAAHDIALTVADTAGRWPMFAPESGGFVYVRLHGAEELYASGYTDEQTDSWAHRILAWASGPVPRDVYVYFDNDAKGHAPHDALRLSRRVRELSSG